LGAVDCGKGSLGDDEETTYSSKFAARTDVIDPDIRAWIMKHKYRLLW